MATPLRIAIIGLGTMAQSLYLPLLTRRHDKFHVAALVDISQRRREDVASKWRFDDTQLFSSTAELVAKVRAQELELDAVVFAADGVKADDILLVIRRGIHVLVEPPAGYGPSDIETMAEFERMAGRRLVMLAYPSLYDSSITEFRAENQQRDIRSLEYETLMPASAVMYGRHHVTATAYDVPTERRAQRRQELKDAVLAGAGEGSTTRDRDLYVKGLLTGIMSQLALVRSMFGAMSEIHGVRHWPQHVVPGSLEVLGAIDKGPHVRLAWHYLPFAPEYIDRIRFISTRRQGVVELPHPADLERRGTYTCTQKTDGIIHTSSKVSRTPSAMAMLEAFHDFAAKGAAPAYGLAEALEDTELAHVILNEIVVADGRSLEAEPDGTTPPEVGPDGTTPVETQPDGTTPPEVGPDGTTPVETQPDGTTPVETQPDVATPSEVSPEDTTPVEAVRDETAHAHPRGDTPNTDSVA